MTDNYDTVNNPKHYTEGGIECIDVMIQTQGIEAVKSFCLCNAFKYIWRHENKNGLEDIKKARWYINKYIEVCENSINKSNPKYKSPTAYRVDKNEADSVSKLIKLLNEENNQLASIVPLSE